MTRLNQIVAIVKSAKADATRALTDAYRLIQQPGLLHGQTRIYKRVNDDDVNLPAETVNVQVKVLDVVDGVRGVLARLFDMVATMDATNALAAADLVVDGVTIAAQVPATHLVWMEKQVVDLQTFIRALPVLDPAERWAFDDQQGLFVAAPSQTQKTKKVTRALILAPATDTFPAQVSTIAEDVVVGFWETVKFSGTITQARKNELLAKVAALLSGVRQAREAANMIEVVDLLPGRAVLAYVFD